MRTRVAVVECPRCEGEGKGREAMEAVCSHCSGFGVVPVVPEQDTKSAPTSDGGDEE